MMYDDWNMENGPGRVWVGGWCKSDNTRWFFRKQANTNANACIRCDALSVDRLETKRDFSPRLFLLFEFYVLRIRCDVQGE